MSQYTVLHRYLACGVLQSGVVLGSAFVRCCLGVRFRRSQAWQLAATDPAARRVHYRAFDGSHSRTVDEGSTSKRLIQ